MNRDAATEVVRKVGGSGWIVVNVVSLDRGDQCGCFGTKIIVYGWVLAEICIVKQRAKKKEKRGKKKMNRDAATEVVRKVGGSGWMAVKLVSLDRGDQCGENGAKIVVCGWVLAEMCTFESRAKKEGEKKDEQGRRDGGRPESGWQWWDCSECGVVG
jgi:hypothetical protein